MKPKAAFNWWLWCLAFFYLFKTLFYNVMKLNFVWYLKCFLKLCEICTPLVFMKYNEEPNNNNTELNN